MTHADPRPHVSHVHEDPTTRVVESADEGDARLGESSGRALVRPRSADVEVVWLRYCESGSGDARCRLSRPRAASIQRFAPKNPDVPLTFRQQYEVLV